jgi:hypothetical protein
MLDVIWLDFCPEVGHIAAIFCPTKTTNHKNNMRAKESPMMKFGK